MRYEASAQRVGLVACLLLVVAASCRAQFDMPGAGGQKDLPAAVRSDIKFIKCSVCQLFVRQSMRTVRKLREELKPGKKLEEGDVIDKLEGLCNVKGPEGEWIRQIDMVEEGDTIELKDMGKVGRHTSETSTVARACVDVSEALDLSDLSEALYKGKSRTQLTQLACYDMSGACSKKPPPVPEDRAAGPEFEELSADEAQREKVMSSLAASGMGGQMYSRDEIKRQMEQLQGRAAAGEFGEGSRLEEALSGGGKGGGGGGVEGLAGRLQEGAAAAAAAAREVAAKAGEAVAGAAGAAGRVIRSLSSKLAGGGGGGAEL